MFRITLSYKAMTVSSPSIKEDFFSCMQDHTLLFSFKIQQLFLIKKNKPLKSFSKILTTKWIVLRFSESSLRRCLVFLNYTVAKSFCQVKGELAFTVTSGILSKFFIAMVNVITLVNLVYCNSNILNF